jgi:hypothetical protein
MMLRSRIRLLLLLVMTVAVCVPLYRICQADDQRVEQLRNMLVINEDDSHFFQFRNPEEMTLAELNAWVDQYANGAVTHLFLCPNAQRASFRSDTRDAIWDPVDGKEPQDKWPQNAKRLHKADLDLYTVWISRCRKTKLSPWLSMRMNDVHNVDEPDHFLHSTFWRKHPEYWRVPNDKSGTWIDKALNYAHPEVREHQMAFIRELLERYDPDGLELDWMRFCYHLTPGKEREEGNVLTKFVREVRALTAKWSKKRNHPILLGVRVPAHPDAASELGMDGVQWAREGLVDLIVPCPFWTSSDFDIPVELWRERLGAQTRRVSVVPGLESSARPWPRGVPMPNNLATLSGFAASAYHRGADGVYLFNWMDHNNWPVSNDDYKVLLRNGVSEKVVAGSVRRHPVCFRDTVPKGFPNNVQLPAAARPEKNFRIHIGPKPASGKVWAVVGLAKRDGLADARFKATLNNRALETEEEVKDLGGLGGIPTRAIRFSCPLDTVTSGYNELKVRQIAGSADQHVVWVEIRLEPS